MIFELTNNQKNLISKISLRGLKRDYPSLVNIDIISILVGEYPYYLDIDITLDFEFEREFVERNIDRDCIHIPGKYGDLTEIPAYKFNECSKHKLDYQEMVEKVVEVSLIVGEINKELDNFQYSCHITSKKE